MESNVCKRYDKTSISYGFKVTKINLLVLKSHAAGTDIMCLRYEWCQCYFLSRFQGWGKHCFIYRIIYITAYKTITLIPLWSVVQLDLDIMSGYLMWLKSYSSLHYLYFFFYLMLPVLAIMACLEWTGTSAITYILLL